MALHFDFAISLSFNQLIKVNTIEHGNNRGKYYIQFILLRVKFILFLMNCSFYICHY